LLFMRSPWPPPSAPVAMEGVTGPRGPECRRCSHAHSHLAAQPDGFARDHPELDHAAFRRCGGCRADRLSVDGEEGGRTGHGHGRGRGARGVEPHPPEQGRAAVGRGLAFGRPLLRLGRGLRQTDVLGCTGPGLRYRPAGGDGDPVPLAAGSIPGETASLTVVLSVLGLALLSTADAYLLYFRLIAKVGPTKTLSVTFFGAYLRCAVRRSTPERARSSWDVRRDGNHTLQRRAGYGGSFEKGQEEERDA
jgi:hypothetical protein